MPHFALLVTLRVAPEAVAEFQRLLLRAAQAAVREEPGCLRFDVAQDEAAPDTFVLFEVYSNPAALEVHHGSAHFRAFQEAAGPWVLEKSRRRLVLASEP